MFEYKTMEVGLLVFMILVNDVAALFFFMMTKFPVSVMGFLGFLEFPITMPFYPGVMIVLSLIW